MSEVLIVCNDASITGAGIDPAAYSQVLHAKSTGPEANLRMEVTDITHALLANLGSRAYDLLSIASYVYWADTSVTRGRDTDVFAEKWHRNFTLLVPVRNPDLWCDPGVSGTLSRVLDWLTDDTFKFTFVPATGHLEQLIVPDFAGQLPLRPDADQVCLFSGGLDSFAGAIDAARGGHLPVLVSHRSIPVLDARQRRVVEGLQEHAKSWEWTCKEFPHIAVWVHRMGSRAVESTLRTRSFLYLAIATAVADGLAIQDLLVYENGITAMSLPRAGQPLGTQRSRSAHPRFLTDFQNLVSLLFNIPFRVSNPFVFLTKAQVLETIRGSGCENLIPATVSCGTTMGATTAIPHCGTCSQCVDRRLSVATAGFESDDELTSYRKDVFVDPLEEGIETAFVENTLRFATEVSQIPSYGFFKKYGEVLDLVGHLPMSSREVLGGTYELHRRFSDEVRAVIKSKLCQHFDDWFDGRLDQDCLLCRISRTEHLRDPLERYARTLSALLLRHTPLACQNLRPTREREVQDLIEAALAAAGERLDREAPLLTYSVVRTKPDFSTPDHKLFIEAKYVDSQDSVRDAHTHMTSRILMYRRQGASVLFTIHDAVGIIKDETRLIEELESNAGVFVAVLRP